MYSPVEALQSNARDTGTVMRRLPRLGLHLAGISRAGS